MVYQDDNNNDVRDGVEISDTINLGVEVVSTPVLVNKPFSGLVLPIRAATLFRNPLPV